MSFLKKLFFKEEPPKPDASAAAWNELDEATSNVDLYAAAELEQIRAAFRLFGMLQEKDRRAEAQIKLCNDRAERAVREMARHPEDSEEARDWRQLAATALRDRAPYDAQKSMTEASLAQVRPEMEAAQNALDAIFEYKAGMRLQIETLTVELLSSEARLALARRNQDEHDPGKLALDRASQLSREATAQAEAEVEVAALFDPEFELELLISKTKNQ